MTEPRPDRRPDNDSIALRPSARHSSGRRAAGLSPVKVLGIVAAASVTVAVVVGATALTTLATVSPHPQAAPPTVYLPARSPAPVAAPAITSTPRQPSTTSPTTTSRATTTKSNVNTAARRAPGRGTGGAERPYIEADRLGYPDCQGIALNDLPGACLCGGGPDGLNDVCP